MSQDSPQPGGGAAPQLPPINAQVNSFDVVTYNVNLAAFFDTYSNPEPAGEAAIRRDGKVIGVEVHEALHRFQIVTPPATREGIQSSNQVGQKGGRFTSRWLFIPDDFQARPELDPPPTDFDPASSQRFVMLGGKCDFGDGDTFEGFGTGRTYPTTVGGQPRLMAGAVGTILKGTGKFADKIGTYTYNGDLTAERGFAGDLLIRVMDPSGDLMTERSIPSLSVIPDPDPDFTYLLLHGQKANEDVPTEYVFNPDGSMQGLKLTQQIHSYSIKWSDKVRQGGEQALSSNTQLRQVVANAPSIVYFNLLDPGAPGTQLEPIPFGSRNEFHFQDAGGNVVGTFVAFGGEGRTWNAELKNLPGQPALRFGAYQHLGEGTGIFEGIEGLLTDNSVVGVSPHTTATTYVMRINDPDGRYRGFPSPVAAVGPALRLWPVDAEHGGPVETQGAEGLADAIKIFLARQGGQYARVVAEALGEPEDEIQKIVRPLRDAGELELRGGRYYVAPGDVELGSGRVYIPLESPPAEEARLSDEERQVVEALAVLGGSAAIRQLATETGLTRGALRPRLASLMEAGRIRRIGQGLTTRYQLVEN